jgi:hypothetical protein
MDRRLHSSACLFVAVMAAAALGSQEEMLQTLARQAKAEGRKEIKVWSSNHTDDAKTDADTYLKDYSIAHVSVSSPVMTATEPSNIYSWHRVRVLQMLRVGPTKDKEPDFDQEEFCQSMPRPQGLKSLARSELGIAAMGGTVTIDGIDVTVTTSNPLSMELGRQDLVIGMHCGDALYLNHPHIDLFLLDAKGQVTWTGLDDFDFSRKLLQLKTIPAIARYVRGLR